MGEYTSPVTLTGTENNLRVDRDIDSYFILATDLRAFRPALTFNVALENPDAKPGENLKAHREMDKMNDMPLLCEPGTECQYREFVFGGYGTESVHVICKINPNVVYQTKLARWRFMQNVTLEALKEMLLECKTRRHNTTNVKTYNKHASITVYKEDWEEFATRMSEKMTPPEGVTTYFYKAKHGVSAGIADAVEELERILADGDEYIAFAQLHFGVEYRTRGSLITFSYSEMSTLAEGTAWNSVTKYKKYFVRGAHGHFSGLRAVTFSRNVTYGQGYDTIAHVLPNKKTPPTWIRQLFNGFMSARPGSVLSALGARLSNASESTREYVDMALREGIGARAEFVWTCHADELRDTLARSDDISRTIERCVVDSGALVRYDNFCASHVELGAFGENSQLLPAKNVVTNFPSGGLIARKTLSWLMDAETILSVWLQSSTRHTSDRRLIGVKQSSATIGRHYGPYYGLYYASGLGCETSVEELRRRHTFPTAEMADYVGWITKYVDNKNPRDYVVRSAQGEH